MKKFGRCVIAVSEGIRDKGGKPIGAMFSGGERDSHGNVQMSGTGALGDYLAKYLKETTGVKRVRADTFGYLQRSFPGVTSLADSIEAFTVGAVAARAVLSGKVRKATVGIVRNKGRRYSVSYSVIPIENAAKFTRSMPKSFIARNGHDVTRDFVEYAAPIVGELPKCEIL